MNKTMLLSLILLLLSAAAVPAIEITSVAPHRTVANTLVTVSGGPFSPRTRVLLGEQSVPLGRILPGRLEFVVPPLPAGSYTLAVHDQGEIAMAHFIFEILPLAPEITAITPDNLDVCADVVERTIQISGKNFQPDTLLLLDGKIAASRIIDTSQMELRVPDLPAGVYGIEARNAGGTASLPHSLWINSVPEITSVERGEDMVNNYDLIIRGKNFFHNSFLVVREPENPATGRNYRQMSLHAGLGAPSGSSNVMTVSGDSLLYEDCGTLVYRRYPFSMQDKDLVLQVINPDGKKTEPYRVFMP